MISDVFGFLCGKLFTNHNKPKRLTYNPNRGFQPTSSERFGPAPVGGSSIVCPVNQLYVQGENVMFVNDPYSHGKRVARDLFAEASKPKRVLNQDIVDATYKRIGKENDSFKICNTRFFYEGNGLYSMTKREGYMNEYKMTEVIRFDRVQKNDEPYDFWSMQGIEFNNLSRTEKLKLANNMKKCANSIIADLLDD